MEGQYSPVLAGGLPVHVTGCYTDHSQAASNPAHRERRWKEDARNEK